MGGAAYNRGTKALRADVDRAVEGARIDPRTAAYRAGQAEGERSRDAEIAYLKGRLAKAERALRLEAAKLHEERLRARAASEAVTTLRDQYRGTGANRSHYVAIIAMLRVERALSGGVAS